MIDNGLIGSVFPGARRDEGTGDEERPPSAKDSVRPQHARSGDEPSGLWLNCALLTECHRAGTLQDLQLKRGIAPFDDVLESRAGGLFQRLTAGGDDVQVPRADGLEN